MFGSSRVTVAITAGNSCHHRWQQLPLLLSAVASTAGNLPLLLATVVITAGISCHHRWQQLPLQLATVAITAGTEIIRYTGVITPLHGLC